MLKSKMQLLFVLLQAYVLWSCASGELVANADLRPALGKRDATSEDAPFKQCCLQTIWTSWLWEEGCYI
ncbi:hypothetical protein ACROYT_G011174 [Oculina patagonica]